MPYGNVFAKINNEYYQLTGAEKKVADYAFGISCYRYSYMGCCYLREVTSRALYAQMLA